MMTTPREDAFTFEVAGAPLVGILHDPGLASERAVVVVVGGPQYRVGAHRQYVKLARDLAEAGTPVLRFDYRGMGDSSGDFRGFEDCGADIAAAIDALTARLPMVREVVLWGLCDGATAIAFYQARNRDPRVAGAVLLNPWARSARTLAETQVRHWYGRRLTSGAFWKKLLTGGVDLPAAAGGLLGTLAARFRSGSGAGSACGAEAPLPDRLAAALTDMAVPVCLMLCGRDLTAREFEEAVLARGPLKRAQAAGHIRVRRLAEANHTYSRPDWRAQVHAWTTEWVQSLGRMG